MRFAALRFHRINAQVFLIDAQQLGERPCLERAAAGHVGLVTVGDLGNMTDAGLTHVIEQRCEKSSPGF
jgi:hypothetical protein